MNLWVVPEIPKCGQQQHSPVHHQQRIVNQFPCLPDPILSPRLYLSLMLSSIHWICPILSSLLLSYFSWEGFWLMMTLVEWFNTVDPREGEDGKCSIDQVSMSPCQDIHWTLIEIRRINIHPHPLKSSMVLYCICWCWHWRPRTHSLHRTIPIVGGDILY